MASVFKRASGGNWLMQIIDRNGEQRQKTSGVSDKKTAKQMANKWEADEAAYRSGVIDESLERLAGEGRRPIAEHVADFEQFLKDKSRSEKHVDQTIRQVRWIVARCEAERIADVTATAVRRAIADLRASGAKPSKKGVTKSTGPRTCNSYLTSIKAFTRWLKEKKRAVDDSLCGEDGLNEASDRRHVRRELSGEEVECLLRETATYTRPEHRMTGPDRAMAYRLALGTGFRASELRRLTPESFDLNADPPTVTVFSKGQRIDVQPIRKDLADLLRPWLAAFEPGEKVFARLARNTARMFRSDLKAARQAWIKAAKGNAEKKARGESDFLKYKNEAGEVADFHATRHTFISNIVASGASVKTAQELARHSTPVLTIGRYSHTRLHDIKGALDGLPGTGGECEAQTLRATGTDGKIAVLSQFTGCETPSGMAKLAAAACEENGPAAVDPDAATSSGERVSCEPVELVATGCDKRRRWESNPRWRICKCCGKLREQVLTTV